MERQTKLTRLPAGQLEYRLERRDGCAVVILHGGHMRAGLALGEEVFRAARCTVLVPSRPGYGRTSLETGPSPEAFADTVAQLCGELDIDQVAAVVGVSAGGRTAMAMAARHPRLVRRLILQSAVGPLPWPDRRTRIGGRVLFNARTEAWTWRLAHALFRRFPDLALRLLLRDLTTQPVGAVVARLDSTHRRTLVDLFTHMRSGAGFTNDLRHLAYGYSRQTTAVTQPALVIATPKDGAVPFIHAQALAELMPGARLLVSDADTHFIWFGKNYPRIGDEIVRFLDCTPGS